MKTAIKQKLVAILCVCLLVLAGCSKKPAPGHIAPAETSEREATVLQMLNTAQEKTSLFICTPPEGAVWMSVSIVEYVNGEEISRSGPMFGLGGDEGLLLVQMSSKGEVYVAHSGGGSAQVPASTSGPFGAATAFAFASLSVEKEPALSEVVAVACVLVPFDNTIPVYDIDAYDGTAGKLGEYAAAKIVTISFEPEISLAQQ